MPCTCTVCWFSTVIAIFYVAFHASGLEDKYFCVLLKFANRTRLAKFTKVNPPRNIWRIQLLMVQVVYLTIRFEEITPTKEKVLIYVLP